MSIFSITVGRNKWNDGGIDYSYTNNQKIVYSVAVLGGGGGSITYNLPIFSHFA